MSEAEYVTLQANERSEAIGRSTAAATRARRRKPSFVAVTLTLALAVLARGASANTPVARARIRQLLDAAVFVVVVGIHPAPTYKWSDEGDRARTIAKNRNKNTRATAERNRTALPVASYQRADVLARPANPCWSPRAPWVDRSANAASPGPRRSGFDRLQRSQRTRTRAGGAG
ncbi:MAG TPA: hypothetical protein VHN14_06435 [Kofleriaceae bacterium]|jgi:hypothetical protein|nr:hypothetical protein [Kofleriaceae bacterium]